MRLEGRKGREESRKLNTYRETYVCSGALASLQRHMEHHLTRLLAHCWTPDIFLLYVGFRVACVVELGLRPHAFKSTRLRISSYFKLQFHQLSYTTQDVSSAIDSGTSSRLQAGRLNARARSLQQQDGPTSTADLALDGCLELQRRLRANRAEWSESDTERQRPYDTAQMQSLRTRGKRAYRYAQNKNRLTHMENKHGYCGGGGDGGINGAIGIGTHMRLCVR